MAGAAAAAAQLRADLQLLDASTKEAASLLDLASWQLGELDRQALPMTSKTLALTKAKENISQAKQRSEEILEHLDSSRKMQGIIQAGPRVNLEAFLAALDRLEAAISFLQAHRSMQSAEDALRHTSALRDSGLAACSQEFAALLQKHGTVPQPALAQLRAAAAEGGGAGGGNRRARYSSGTAGAAAEAGAGTGAGGAGGVGAPLQLLPEAVLPKLQALAAAMVRGGSGRSCTKMYADARRGVLDRSLEGFLSPFAATTSSSSSSSTAELARLSWQQMEGKIPGWVAAVRLFVRLAQEEARLCAAIFAPAEQAAVLAQVAASGLSSILDGAEAVLAARRVPDKLFGVLDMHDAADSSLLPLKAALLAAGGLRLDRTSMGVSAAEQLQLVGQLSQLRGRLATEVRACFSEVQDSIARDAPKGGVPADGTVHPLCASTVALLKRIVGSESALAVLFSDAATSAAARGGGGLAEEARLLDRMAAAVGRIFDTLLAALEAKGKLAYKSRALAALHQMNNVHFIVRAVEGSRELKAVGEGWVELNKGKVDEYQQLYVEQGWGSLLLLLRQDARQALPANLAGDKAARQAIKDKWSAVNKVLGEVQAQQGWAVPDATLRFAVKDALSDALLQPYEAFCSKYQRAAYSENRSKYERYRPSDLQSLLNELFERAEAGAPGLVGRSPGSTSGNSLLGRMASTSMRRMTSSSQGTP